MKLTFDLFNTECEKSLTIKYKCPRKVQTHKNCITDSRRKNCFSKYTRKIDRTKIRKTEKNKVDRDLYEKLVSEVWLRDADYVPDTKIKNWNVKKDWDQYCRFYKCLNPNERVIYFNSIKESETDFFLLTLVMAHRISKGSTPGLKYDSNNVFLISRLAHDRIDKSYSPLTGELINKEQRMYWWERIADG